MEPNPAEDDAQSDDPDDFFAPADAEVKVDDDASETLAAQRLAEQAKLEEIRSEQQDQDDSLGRQRRQNVRVDVQFPITLSLNGREKVSRTRDVSATGVGFSTRVPVKLEDRGEVTVDFPDWRFTKPFVVRFVKPIIAGNLVGVQFEDLSEEERERLVKQVFDVQRAQLQEGRKR